VALLNVLAVNGRVGRIVPLRRGVLYPAAAAAVTSFGMYYLWDTLAYFIPSGLATLGSLAAGIILYFLLLVMWGSLAGGICT